MLQPENVCDLIVEAIRKEEHLLLIPKILKLGIILKRFERSHTSGDFCNGFLFFLLFSMTSTRSQIESLGSTGVHHSMDKFVGRR